MTPHRCTVLDVQRQVLNQDSSAKTSRAPVFHSDDHSGDGHYRSGKTTVGRLLAERLHWAFADADDFHSAANKEKMRHGIPLTDADRDPWLAAIREQICAGPRQTKTA